MAETKSMAALFDFDGVVVDTETQYSVFWHKMGVDYLGMEDLEKRIKGQTLVYIYDTFFSGMDKEQQELPSHLTVSNGNVFRFHSGRRSLRVRPSPQPCPGSCSHQFQR